MRTCTRVMVVMATATCLVVGWWNSGGELTGEATSPAKATGSLHRRPANVVPVAPPAEAFDTSDASDTALIGFVADKYRLLVTDLFEVSADTEALQNALLDRERIAVALNTARQSRDAIEREAAPVYETQLAAADARIQSLLHPTDYAAFEVLKDSDIEQFQLEDYAAGISNVAPLSAENRRAILLTKLHYKRYFRQVLLDSGLLNRDLSANERQQVVEEATRALAEYRDSYLAEVRQYLFDDEQYALLRNYEASEFAAETAKLRSMAGG